MKGLQCTLKTREIPLFCGANPQIQQRPLMYSHWYSHRFPHWYSHRCLLVHRHRNSHWYSHIFTCDPLCGAPGISAALRPACAHTTDWVDAPCASRGCAQCWHHGVVAPSPCMEAAAPGGLMPHAACQGYPHWASPALPPLPAPPAVVDILGIRWP